MSKRLMLVFVVGVMAAFGLACGFAKPEPTFPPATVVPTTPPNAKVTNLEIRNFTHQSAEVEVGDLIIWTNFDQPLHTVNHIPDQAADPVEFNSGNIPPREGFRHLFMTPGVYNYQCIIHPISMKGTITVKPKAAAAATN
ncbi:MAG: hypothetical protein FJ319_14430 [SAR202 cluster bacterium]|nr:hypothetical protein [SAR202 cluster bacterium]